MFSGGDKKRPVAWNGLNVYLEYTTNIEINTYKILTSKINYHFLSKLNLKLYQKENENFQNKDYSFPKLSLYLDPPTLPLFLKHFKNQLQGTHFSERSIMKLTSSLTIFKRYTHRTVLEKRTAVLPLQVSCKMWGHKTYIIFFSICDSTFTPVITEVSLLMFTEFERVIQLHKNQGFLISSGGGKEVDLFT